MRKSSRFSYAEWITTNFHFFVSNTCICFFFNVFHRTTIASVHPTLDDFRCNETVIDAFINGLKIWNNILYIIAVRSVAYDFPQRFITTSITLPFPNCSPSLTRGILPNSVIPLAVRWQPYCRPVSTFWSHLLVHPRNVFDSTLYNFSYLLILFIV